jgi:hypothetical protein
MSKIKFGHCIGCDQPVRPPYLSFKVMQSAGDGTSVTEWEEVDVCDDCAGKLTADDLHRLVFLEDEPELPAPEDGPYAISCADRMF